MAKLRIQKGSFWLVLLSLLGFTTLQGCKMYGSPYASYDVNVKTVNKQGVPIEGLSVEKDNKPLGLTGADGYAKGLTWSDGGGAIYFNVRDIDGAQNGYYKDTTLNVKVEQGDWKDKGDGSWYQGRVEKDVTVEMTAKDE